MGLAPFYSPKGWHEADPERGRAMIRKLILSAVMATATVAGVTSMPATAEANPPALFPRRFEVMVHRGPQGWQSHGTYKLHAQAELVAIRLRHAGNRVEIREFFSEK